MKNQNFTRTFKTSETVLFNLLFAFLSSIFAAVTGSAQDFILLQNGDEIKSKVLEISPTEVKYKNWSNLEGPSIIINRTDVWMIKYENGSKDLMAKTQARNLAETTSQNRTTEAAKPADPVLSNQVNPAKQIYINPKRYTALLYGAVSIPIGDFKNPAIGAAKTGFSIGFEESRRFGDSDLSLLGHLSFSTHGLNETINSDNISYTFSGRYSLLWSMGGLKYQSSGKSGGFYALAMAGLCYGNFSVDNDGPSYLNNVPLCFGLGAGYSFGTLNIGIRFLSNESVFSSPDAEPFKQSIQSIHATIGLEF